MFTEHLNNEIINSLTPSEQAILQYIYSHSNAIEHATIREVAERLCVSTTTILRFCNKLNLSGYSELKYLLKKNNEQQIKNDITNKETGHLSHFIANDIENTLLLIKEENIAQVINELNSTKNIHLFSGGGITAKALDYLEKLLFSYGRQNVYRYESERLAAHVCTSLTKNDVVILISASGTYEPTIRMANLSKMNSATIIAISPYTDNVLARIADINFRFISQPRFNKNTEFTSRLPIFFIIDTIFKAYLTFQEGSSND